jgi:hypothetical protein
MTAFCPVTEHERAGLTVLRNNIQENPQCEAAPAADSIIGAIQRPIWLLNSNCIPQLVIREIVLTKRVCMLSMSFSRR